MRVVDNFIPNLFMNRVNSLLEGNTFNWFWNSNTTKHHNDNNFLYIEIGRKYRICANKEIY